jgi:PAS domain S-box-containing protein
MPMSAHDAGPDLDSDPVEGVLSLIPDAAVVVDATGTIVAVNAKVSELFGYAHAELVGQPVEMLTPDRVRVAHAELREGYAAKPRARSMGAGLDLSGRRADGSEFPVDISLAPFQGVGGQLVIAAIRDMTDAHQARELVLLAQDRERIARDLHDLVIQRLFAAGLTLQSVTNLVDDAAALERIDAVVDDLDTTIRDIRTTIFTLSSNRRSPGEGVRDAILEIAREARRSLGFEPGVRFRGPIDTVVTPAIADHLLAVTREGLSNAARHADASSVDVEVVVSDDLALVIEDDGVGIGTDVRESGLANMRERAETLGGRLDVTRREGGGTRLEWHVPLA